MFWRTHSGRHGVSANAGKTKPAKLLAVFMVDTNVRRRDRVDFGWVP
jgi:hypothetical protein